MRAIFLLRVLTPLRKWWRTVYDKRSGLEPHENWGLLLAKFGSLLLICVKSEAGEVFPSRASDYESPMVYDIYI